MSRTTTIALAAVAALLLVSCSDATSGGRIGDSTTSRPEQADPLIAPELLEGTTGSGDVYSFSEAIESGLGDLTTVVSPEDLALIAAGSGTLDYLNLYEDVKEATYSVGYRVAGELVESIPGTVAFSIVHEPDRVKNAAAADDTVATIVIEDAGGTTSCAKYGTWTCEPAKSEVQAYGAESLLLLLGVVSETPGAFDIETYTTAVVDVPVRCLKATPVSSASAPAGFSEPIEVCVTGEGVPLRVSVPTLTLDGVWYRPSVDPSEFDLPA